LLDAALGGHTMNKIEAVTVAPTTERKTVPGRFAAALRGAAEGLASGIAAGVELAAPYVPGGMVLSAAVRGAANASRGSAASPGSPGSPVGGTGGAGPDGDGDIVQATRALQQEARTFNLQYLQLQEGMQRESREFTALSNVMRVKHDTAKSAINNIH
jgi:hypothetical protein